MTVHELNDLARWIRRRIIESTTAAGSGHPSSSLSAVELMAVLFGDGFFRARLTRPKHPTNDRLIFSKGHAAPLLYALYAAAGAYPPAKLRTLRKLSSMFQGHPMPDYPYADVPTGSLGQGLSAGVGMAIAAAMDRHAYRTYVLLGDSELSEGSVWEALQLAAYYRLDNLTAIVDMNGLGQRGPTMLGHEAKALRRRVEAFGWKTRVVDGHDVREIHRAYREAGATRRRPFMVIAKTTKGRGVSLMSGMEGWHGKTLSESEAYHALEELEPEPQWPELRLPAPPAAGRAAAPVRVRTAAAVAPEPRSPRKAIGDALVRLGAGHSRLTVLDAEVSNSTATDAFFRAYPERFLQCFIAEQNMAGIATGLAARGRLPIAATFAAFLTRAYDQLRMAGYAGSHQVYVGTHAGVHTGQDGPSQMGLEDVAMMRAVQGSSVWCPADGVAAERITEAAVAGTGIHYIRAARAVLPTLYAPDHAFHAGGSATLRSTGKDDVSILAAGVTVHEALAAASSLAGAGVRARVIDLYSIKPIDAAAVQLAARETKRIIVAEDHVPEGGLGEAVRSALGAETATIVHLAVRRLPRSGTPAELLKYERIDRTAIKAAALRMMRGA